MDPLQPHHGNSKLEVLQASCKHEQQVGTVGVPQQAMSLIVGSQQPSVGCEHMYVVLKLPFIEAETDPGSTCMKEIRETF